MNPRLSALFGSIVAVAVAGLIALAASDGSLRAGRVPIIVWCVIAAFAINWIVFVPAWFARTEKFFDLTGSLTYFAVTGLALVLSGADQVVQWLLAILIWIWAARLGSFLFRRILADGGEDARFAKLRVDFLLFLQTWSLQGLWVSVTACAAWTAIAAAEDQSVGVFTVVGAVVWLIGFGIEVRADAEKSRFKANPANKGRFISTGLWAWSRHPNYFGEITLWVGIALIALPSMGGWRYLTLISPVFVFVLITRISGIPMLERRGTKRWGDEPAYQRYVASTPALMLRPPKR